jgi:Zn-dependent protease/CBS domain-containing protein
LAGTRFGVERRPLRGVFGGGAWRVGQLAGIEIAVDHSWVLIFLFITLSLASYFGVENRDWSSQARWAAALLASPLFFLSILLHELGHSLTARRRGIAVRSITLFVFGGIARLASEPKRPRDEIVIALAGPLVSVALGMGFIGLAELLPTSSGPAGILGEAFSWLGAINLVLAVFNGVPGFPLDGGRVLRGIVWAVTGSFERATALAAGIGSVFAFSFIGLGIIGALISGQWVGGLWLAFIGWFLLIAARTTAGQALLRQTLKDLVVGESMDSADGVCLTGGETVDQVTSGAALPRGPRILFVVETSGVLRGLVTLKELTRVPASQRAFRMVHEIMVPVRQLRLLDPRESLWVAFRRMAESGMSQLPVVEQGRLVGVVTRERIIELVQIRMKHGGLVSRLWLPRPRGSRMGTGW